MATESDPLVRLQQAVSDTLAVFDALERPRYVGGFRVYGGQLEVPRSTVEGTARLATILISERVRVVDDVETPSVPVAVVFSDAEPNADQFAIDTEPAEKLEYGGLRATVQDAVRRLTDYDLAREITTAEILAEARLYAPQIAKPQVRNVLAFLLHDGEPRLEAASRGKYRRVAGEPQNT